MAVAAAAFGAKTLFAMVPARVAAFAAVLTCVCVCWRSVCPRWAAVGNRRSAPSGRCSPEGQ